MPPKRKSSSKSAGVSVTEAVEAQRKKLAEAGKKAAKNIMTNPPVRNDIDTPSSPESEAKSKPVPDSRELDDDMTDQLLSKYAPEQMYVPPPPRAAPRKRSTTPKKRSSSPARATRTPTVPTKGPFTAADDKDVTDIPSPPVQRYVSSGPPNSATSAAGGLSRRYGGLDTELEPEPEPETNAVSAAAVCTTHNRQQGFHFEVSPTSDAVMLMAYGGGAIGGVVVIAVTVGMLLDRVGEVNLSGASGMAAASTEMIRENLGVVIVAIGVGTLIAAGLYTLLKWVRTRQRRESLLAELLALLKQDIRSKQSSCLSAGGYPSRFYMEELADQLEERGRIGASSAGSGEVCVFSPPVARREVVALWPEVESLVCAEDTRIRRFELTVNGEKDWMFQWLRGDDYVAFGQAESSTKTVADNSVGTGPIFAKTGLSYT